MASLLDVRLRAPEPTDQEISEALLRTWEILRPGTWVPEGRLADLSIEGGDQARETFRTNHGINFEFLHLPSSPIELFGYPFLTKSSSVCDASSMWRRTFQIADDPWANRRSFHISLSSVTSLDARERAQGHQEQHVGGREWSQLRLDTCPQTAITIENSPRVTSAMPARIRPRRSTPARPAAQ